MPRIRFPLWPLVLAGCGDDPLPPGRVELTQGEESDTWSREPRVERIEVELLKPDGRRERFASLDSPSPDGEAPTFELTVDEVSQFEVRGLDADEQVQALGLSWPYDPAGLQGFQVRLFVGRVGELGRAPDGLARGMGEQAPAASLAGRYLVLAGEGESGWVPMEGYDLGTFSAVTFAPLPCPSEPCRARSLAVASETIVVAISDDWAVTADLGASTASSAYELPPPGALESWADVAGGASLTAPDGTAYVVGATRTGPPTPHVIRVAPDGETRALRLTEPRAGASAAWLEGLGLVVSGGSETASGVELLAEGASTFSPLPFEPDPVTGAALVPLEDGSTLRVGGRGASGYAPTVSLDLGCRVGCAPRPYGDPLNLDGVLAFALADGSVLAVGSDAAGDTRVLRVIGDPIGEVTLREPRRGASAIHTALGHVALLGGALADGDAATSLELYTPRCLALGCPDS